MNAQAQMTSYKVISDAPNDYKKTAVYVDVFTADTYLNAKEKELLHHMVAGKSYKMISDAMKISLETVKFHIKNIYRKLHVNSSSEAIVKAIKQNIV
jgi:DNA-binding CsgD family transcriptional regulator